jgi:hypothetical protein
MLKWVEGGEGECECPDGYTSCGGAYCDADDDCTGDDWCFNEDIRNAGKCRLQCTTDCTSSPHATRHSTDCSSTHVRARHVWV